MSENPEPAPIPRRRGVPLWAQIFIWAGLLGLLALIGIGVARSQHPIMTVGSAVPNFSLTFYNAYEYADVPSVKLADLHGKVVLVNFWASWCVPCETEAAYLQTAWQAYQPSGRVVFLGVDYVDTPAEALAYLKKFNISYPTGPDLQTDISHLFNRDPGVPETYVIDQHGRLRFIEIGPFQSLADIQAVIDPLLAEK